jgi:hypothetical protein
VTDPVDPIPPEEPLGPEDVEPFHKAILEAYPDVDDLEILLSHKWGVRLSDQVYLEQPGRKVANELIKWAQSEGRTRELLGLLWSGRPGNPRLRPLAERLLGSLEPVAARYGARPLAEAAPVIAVTRASLEKTVTERSRLVDFGAFVAKLAGASAPVCRVETPLSAGTGFLVGRRSVLTNFHVVKEALGTGMAGEQVLCRFDYRIGDDGRAAEGVALAAAPGPDWIVAHSPYSDSDLTGSGSPAPGELDFALIRLAARVDDARPHMRLSRDPPIVAPLDIAMIVQHPGGNPLMIAMGVVVEFPATGLRYRYNTTTGPGASGSPVFSADVELIGLHHAADPASAPRYNQAVPIWRVARAVEAAGHAPDAL